MPTFRADLHVHSRFSRATSPKLNVRHLAAWSMVKGLSVMSTGDFTHPAWREELRRDLVFDESSGLYRVREEVAVETEIPGFVRPNEAREPLFLIQAEISSIYKKNGAVRKVHNLVFMPDLDSADRLSAKLAAIGNITSDGRPILGLDSERLLEMVLETSDRAVLIPAHIWTPWFSLFGSKSGFDALEDCFGALSSHVFALETGLSSDPEMNRLWSGLDRYALVSNSDAHSGENLGREANLFTGTPSYNGMFDALRRSAQGLNADADCVFRGTMEFFPEEGKYHLDGHRACDVVLEPEESRKLGNICPVCGKPLTVGVLHRVKELADRQTPYMRAGDAGFVSLIPLPEMLGELLDVGAKSRKVQTRQAELVRLFGSELDILHSVPEIDLRQHWDALGEAVTRMRRGEVIREGGYDGEYGVVRVFTPQERDDLVSGTCLLGVRKQSAEKKTLPKKHSLSSQTPHSTPNPFKDVRVEAAGSPQKTVGTEVHAAQKSPDPARFPYSEAQQQAIAAGPHPVLVLAGPGAGKTRTLVGRVQRLVRDGVPVERMLAVTFTRRAAAELRERLTLALAPTSDACQTPPGTVPALPRADTLHALALSQWVDSVETPVPAVLSEEAARAVFVKANTPPFLASSKSSANNKKGKAAPVAKHPEIATSETFEKKAETARLRNAWATLALNRERLLLPDAELGPLLERYTAYKKARNLADYTDLLEHWLARLTADGCPSDANPNPTVNAPHDTPRLWTDVLVDEIQDFSPLQIALVLALLPSDGTRAGQGFFGIGDPDQAVYGFRGAHPDVRSALVKAWPTLETITLSDSHRSAAGILTSASHLLGPAAACGQLVSTRQVAASLHLFCAPDSRQEAAWIADQIATLLGGTSHTLEDARRTESPLPTPCSPGDIAVLVRLKALMPPLKAALEQRGIPCAVPQAAPFWNDPGVGVMLEVASERKNEHNNGDEAQHAIWTGGPAALLTYLEQEMPQRLPPDNLFRESAAFAALLRAYREQGSWEALLDWVLFRQDLDLVREQAEQVQIMTLHAAKGLEFRVVFLPALEEGLLPFSGAGALLHTETEREEVEREETDVVSEAAVESASVAEERRLLYVGLTRAQDAVFASHAEQRTVYGQTLCLPPSRFLRALPDLFKRTRLVRHTVRTAKQMSLL